MNIFKYLLQITIISLLLVACNDDFFDKQPPGTASGNVMSTEKGVESILIGAYKSLYGGDIFGGSAFDWEMGDMYSDNAGFGAQNAYHAVENYEVLAENSYPRVLWSSAYSGVARANDVLNFLKLAKDIKSERTKQIEAEAKFIRAWQHFKLQRVFWQIPYIKTAEELGDVDPASVPNDHPVWDEIEADLQFCIDNLPENHIKNEPGRPTKYSAMAVKARVHLFQNEYSDAKPLLDNIINSGKFKLVDNFYDNFRETTENNEESIFEIQCNVGDVFGSSNTLKLTFLMHQNGPAGKGWGAFQPTQNLFEAYQVDENGFPILDEDLRDDIETDMGKTSSQEFIPTDHPLDPRVDWTIARRGIPFLDWGVHAGASWIRSQFHGGPYMTVKYMHYMVNNSTHGSGGGSSNDRNFRAYRYAFILLWRAEVAIEDGDLELARNLINQVRERAKNEVVMGKCTTYIFDGRPVEINYNLPAANYKVSPYPTGHEAFSSKENARKAVRHELRLETATEGHRFFDLRRWDIDNEVLNKYIEHDTKYRFIMKGYKYDPELNDYWPLPQDQLDIQPALKQDPSYE